MSRRTKPPRFALAVNRKWLLAMAFALLAAALVLLVQLNRPSATVEYLVANRDQPAGTQLEASAFTPVALALGASGGRYVSSLPSGQLTRPLRAGELLAADDVGLANARFSVVLSPCQPVSARIHVGSLVDVWFVAKSVAVDAASAPVRVAADLEVRALSAIDTGLSGGLNSGLSKVELAVSEADLPALMLASADGGFISVVGSD